MNHSEWCFLLVNQQSSGMNQEEEGGIRFTPWNSTHDRAGGGCVIHGWKLGNMGHNKKSFSSCSCPKAFHQYFHGFSVVPKEMSSFSRKKMTHPPPMNKPTLKVTKSSWRWGGKGELGARIPSNGHWYSEVSYLSILKQLVLYPWVAFSFSQVLFAIFSSVASAVFQGDDGRVCRQTEGGPGEIGSLAEAQCFQWRPRTSTKLDSQGPFIFWCIFESETKRVFLLGIWETCSH